MLEGLGLKDIAKGSMNATSATLSGSLTPEQATSLINVIKDNSEFLQKIHVEKMSRLTKELDGWDAMRGVLVRVASGEKPSDAQRTQLKKAGVKLEAKSVQLFSRILQDALADNQNNPNFESETFNSFGTIFGNDLALLGFSGTSDTYANSFETLHKGWIQTAKDSSDVTKVTYVANDSVSKRLTALAQSINPDALVDSVILISTADMQEYNKEISALNAPTYLINGNADRVLGVKLEVSPLMPKGVYMATPLKNLVLGVCLDINRNRWYDPEERALKYIFDASVDYEIIIKKWVSIATL